MTEKYRENRLKEWIKTTLKYHIADSTAMIIESTPVFAVFETGIADISDDVSLNARFIAAGTIYGGVGWIYGKCRDLWRKGFHINNETKEKVQQLHDFVYTGVFNLGLLPALYFAAGTRDIKEMAIGTGVGALV